MGWLDQLRGAAIAVALVAHGIYALPLPTAINEKAVKEPWRQRDLELWQEALQSVGIEIEKRTLERWLIESTGSAHDLHQRLKKPFRPVFRLTATNQAWALFASATTRPERFVIEIRPRGQITWEPIHRRLDPCCRWREDLIRYRRIRGIYDGQADRLRPAYRNLTPWLAGLALRDHPDADAVQIYVEQSRSTYPWEPDDPAVEIRNRRIHLREQP
ncbi:MAG TPA: hypothetical protein ENK18_17800 [Deltaproteobacteria bacterium]|nr:hypothetical protein [Deltaproteobacteria bacterium]